MSTKWSMYLVAAAFAALPVAGAQAADSGVYLGVGAAQANFKDQVASPSGGTLDFDASSNGGKGFLGYRLKAIPLLDFAAEGGYHYFGKATQTVSGHALSYRMDAGSVAGLVILPLGPVDLFGKGGAMYSTLSKNIDGTTTSRTGSNAFYGAGIGFNVGAIGIRAEYEYIDASNLSRMQVYSASFLIKF